MAINQVNTVAEEQKFKFNKNQSDILHTIETNNITVNAVNKIVKKPKKGDIMCITRYKENNVLLEADKQKVVWIDGLSINLTQLSPLYDPVGICVSVKGNKALVKYKEEKQIKSTSGYRWLLPNSSIMTDGAEHTLQITLDSTVNANLFVFTSSSRKEFVDKLNAWFLANNTNYSAELVELNTDLPAVDTTDTKDGSNYRNRIIVNDKFIDGYKSTSGFKIEEVNVGKLNIVLTTGKPVIKPINWYYYNNGRKDPYNNRGGCCRARYYDYVQNQNFKPSKPMTSILSAIIPMGLTAFTSNVNCQILRDNFASYDEYIESYMAKYPCGAGGIIAKEPCGKENTYKLTDCTFLDNTTSKQEILYPAANYAASIDLNAPKLGKGNWWLPSAAEMVEIMLDITYGTSFWNIKPDIINRVLTKLNSFDNSWSMLDGSIYRWTSSFSYYWDDKSIYYTYCCTNFGCLYDDSFYSSHAANPVTIYEF